MLHSLCTILHSPHVLWCLSCLLYAPKLYLLVYIKAMYPVTCSPISVVPDQHAHSLSP